MKRVVYSCDHCPKTLGPDFTAAKQVGAVALTIKGAINKNDTWAQHTDLQFCSVLCMAEYMSTYAKELIAQTIVEQ